MSGRWYWWPDPAPHYPATGDMRSDTSGDRVRIEWGNLDGDGSVIPSSWSPKEDAEDRARRIGTALGLPVMTRTVTTSEWRKA